MTITVTVSVTIEHPRNLNEQDAAEAIAAVLLDPKLKMSARQTGNDPMRQWVDVRYAQLTTTEGARR